MLYAAAGTVTGIDWCRGSGSVQYSTVQAVYCSHCVSLVRPPPPEPTSDIYSNIISPPIKADPNKSFSTLVIIN